MDTHFLESFKFCNDFKIQVMRPRDNLKRGDWVLWKSRAPVNILKVVSKDTFMVSDPRGGEMLLNRHTFELPFRKLDSKKDKISAGMKSDVWEQYIGRVYDAKCFCCDYRDISCRSDGFEAGHVIAEARGGPTVLENLRPICSSCNMRMGTKNLFDYKDTLKQVHL